jgi:hypothetical protein
MFVGWVMDFYMFGKLGLGVLAGGVARAMRREWRLQGQTKAGFVRGFRPGVSKPAALILKLGAALLELRQVVP